VRYAPSTTSFEELKRDQKRKKNIFFFFFTNSLNHREIIAHSALNFGEDHKVRVAPLRFIFCFGEGGKACFFALLGRGLR
jgi:hypothetical protein